MGGKIEDIASAGLFANGQQDAAQQASAAGLPPSDAHAGAPNRDNTLAIIVTYHPSDSIVALVHNVRLLTSRFVIVDNHSSPQQLVKLQDLAAAYGGELMALSGNLGIAAAFNLGLRRALDAPAIEWVLLFDQDTVPFPEMLSEFAFVYTQHPRRGQLGVIGANYIASGLHRAWYGDGLDTNPWSERNFVISSGSLVSVAALRSCGLLREEFFIDYVDQEFCLRLQAGGYLVVCTRRPLMLHSIGASTEHVLLGKKVIATNHRPVRSYYMTRNLIATVEHHFFSSPKAALGLLYSRFWVVLALFVFEQDRVAKIRYMWLGLVHGLLSRYDYSPLAD